jgi:hypothetical protein
VLVPLAFLPGQSNAGRALSASLLLFAVAETILSTRTSRDDDV